MTRFIIILTLVLLSTASLAGKVDPDLAKRWQSLSEAEKQRYRSLHEKFTELPPEKQRALAMKFEAYKKMSPEKRDRVKSNHVRLRTLSAEDRKAYDRLVKEFRQLPRAEKVALKRVLLRAKKLPLDKQNELCKLVLNEARKTNPNINDAFRVIEKCLNTMDGMEK